MSDLMYDPNTYKKKLSKLLEQKNKTKAVKHNISKPSTNDLCLRMSNLMYDPHTYKKKLGKLLKQKKQTKTVKYNISKPSTNDLCNSSSPLFRSKQQLLKRKPTPYHPTTSKSKLTTNTSKTQQLFNSYNTDDEESSERDAYELEEDNVNIFKCLTPSIKSYNIGQNVQSSPNKNVASCKKSKKREATPYHPVNKRNRRNTSQNHKQILFECANFEVQDETDSDNYENNFIEPVNLFMSTSESQRHGSNSNLKQKVKKQKCSKKKQTVANILPVDDRMFMEADEVISNDIHYEGVMSSSDSNFEDSEYFEELNITSDCTTSIVYDNIRLLDSDEKDNGSFVEENENVLESSEDESNENINTENSVVDLREEIIGEFKCFSFKDMAVVVLQSNSKLYFHGLMSVTILQGVLEVLGYTLTTSSGAVEIFSPRGSSFLYFQTKDECVSHVLRNDLTDTLSKLGMKSQTLSDFCRNLQRGSTVILCKKVNSFNVEFLEKHTSQQVFPKYENAALQCVFQNKIGNWNVLNVNVEWDSLLNNVHSSSRVFICGGKSVGKSTMLRYMINKLLLKYPEILIIDLDPGQPEFTVGGCISATIVKQPVFGPNYTHLRKPSRCLFLHNINISYAPDAYISSVEELILSCADLQTIPTIINYMGFTRGLGLEILSAVVAYTGPTCIIEIQSNSSRRNFKQQLTYKLIHDKAKLFASKVKQIQKFPIYTVPSMADSNQGWHLEPRQIREMCVLAYLSKMLPKDVSSLTSTKIPVYTINMSQIKIIYNGQMANPEVVNANLVALCSKRDSYTSYDCHGWGVVRGVDLLTNELFLLTPVPPDELEQVDHLILGSVALPPSLYMTSPVYTSYVLEGEIVPLGQIPKRSHLAPKRRND